MKDNEIIEQYKKQLEKPTLFFIVDKRDQQIIAVKEGVFHGYNGFVINDENNPIYVAKTYIASEPDRFDFTQDENTARSFEFFII